LRGAEPLGLAGHQGGVQLAGAHAFVHQLLGAGKLVIHRALELLEGNGTANRAAVDEEVGGALHAELLGQGHVRIHGSLVGVPVQGRLELAHVQADLFRVFFDRGAIQVGLVGKQGVVHLPELALGARGQGGLGGQRRLVVEGQGVVLEVDANLIRVLLEQAVQGGHDPAAVRALELGELDDGDQGLG
jgi:hypothetical protein